MLTQRLDLKLLFPILIVCLILVGACLFGALHLSRLHVNVARDVQENFQSTQAAIVLETTIQQMIDYLDRKHSPTSTGKRLEELEKDADSQLAVADHLADHDAEKEQVSRIRAGLKDFQTGRAKGDPPDVSAKLLRDRVLDSCIKLRDYNLGQIEQSDGENRGIVETLRWGMLIVGVGGSLSGLLMGYLVARKLRHSIGRLSVRIRDAAGRLNRDLGSVTVKPEGDLTDLDRQMGHVLDEIGRTIDQLQQREHEVLRTEQLAAVGQLAAGVAHRAAQSADIDQDAGANRVGRRAADRAPGGRPGRGRTGSAAHGGLHSHLPRLRSAAALRAPPHRFE